VLEIIVAESIRDLIGIRKRRHMTADALLSLGRAREAIKSPLFRLAYAFFREGRYIGSREHLNARAPKSRGRMKHEVSRITHLELPNKEHIVASATLILRVKVSYVEHEVERVLEIYRVSGKKRILWSRHGP
jgi:hypothetical protein